MTFRSFESCSNKAFKSFWPILQICLIFGNVIIIYDYVTTCVFIVFGWRRELCGRLIGFSFGLILSLLFTTTQKQV